MGNRSKLKAALLLPALALLGTSPTAAASICDTMRVENPGRTDAQFTYALRECWRADEERLQSELRERYRAGIDDYLQQRQQQLDETMRDYLRR